MWSTHLLLEGLVYRLYPDDLPLVNAIGEGEVNAPHSYDLWMKTFEWNFDGGLGSHMTAHYHSTLAAAHSLLRQLNAAGNAGQVGRLGRRLMAEFPNEARPWDMRWISIANQLAEGGGRAEAEAIGLGVARNFQSGPLATDPDRPAASVELVKLAQRLDSEALRKQCANW
jgi:hypothetical protein